MKRGHHALVAASLAAAFAGVLIACGDDRPSTDTSFSTPDGSARVASGANAAGTTLADASPDARAEAGVDASSDASLPDGGADAGDPDADAGPMSFSDPPICPTTIALGMPNVATFSTAEADLGLSVTLDGLSAAWTTEAGGVVTIHVVDRPATTDGFGSERTIAGTYASGRVALAQSGLGLAIVNADGLGITYLARAARTDAFGPPDVGPFSGLATFATNELAPAGERLANPLFARDDAFLFFTRITAAGWVTYVATRFGTEAPFSGGAPYVEGALGVAGARRVLTGASKDLRTLFVWDDVGTKTHVLQLSATSEPVSDVPVGEIKDLQTTIDCKTFWYVSGGDLVRSSP